MIRIPNIEKKFSQPNNSDLFGNIHYTKSVNFDEEGYLKLSSRTISLKNEEVDGNFDIPTAFGRHTDGSFYIATTEKPYGLVLNDTTSSFNEDTDDGGDPHPSLDFTTHGKWWQSRWHITNNTELYYKTKSNGNWTNTNITNLTTGKPHPIEVFEKAGTLMVADINTVRQLDTSYAVGANAQLTLSTDYEVISLAYNNNLLGIGTRLASTIEGQNTEAKFFTWDGSESSPNASYGIGSDAIITVFPYKSSFGIITRAGQILYFNGGGFDKLATFPVYFKDIIWGSSNNVMGYGDMVQVDGDVLYININSSLKDNKLNTYTENMLGGIWCFDPNVGLYHRYSPSISQGQVIYAGTADVDISTNIVTVNTLSMPTSPTIPPTGSPVKAINSNVGGITTGNTYYLIKDSTTTYKLATSKENALFGTAIDLTSAGVLVILTYELKDYGQSRTARPGAIALMGNKTQLYNNLIFGGEYYDTNSTTAYANLNISVAGLKNIGYFVTAKINSQHIEDIIPKIYIKYRPLDTDDKIILKYKNKDFVGIPEIASCTASGKNALYTTSNIPKSYAFANRSDFGTEQELECEIISGAGAGEMAKITSISYESGTYAIFLDRDIEGMSAGDNMSIKIDNWKELYTITSDDNDNWKEIPLAKTSKWTKLKVVLEGNETTIEEILPINATFREAK